MHQVLWCRRKRVTLHSWVGSRELRKLLLTYPLLGCSPETLAAFPEEVKWRPPCFLRWFRRTRVWHTWAPDAFTPRSNGTVIGFDLSFATDMLAVEDTQSWEPQDWLLAVPEKRQTLFMATLISTSLAGHHGYICVVLSCVPCVKLCWKAWTPLLCSSTVTLTSF